MSPETPDVIPDGKEQAALSPAEEQNGQSNPMSGARPPLEQIPGAYKQAGYVMGLIKREGQAAMYADASGTYFEVHKVRVAKPKMIFGKEYPEREILAGNEDFGTYAWACSSKERAEFRFANILAESKL
mgnify:CR=1 FL=1